MKLNKCEEENVLSSLGDLTAQQCAKYGSNCHSIWKDWGNLLSLRMVTSLSVTLTVFSINRTLESCSFPGSLAVGHLWLSLTLSVFMSLPSLGTRWRVCSHSQCQCVWVFGQSPRGRMVFSSLSPPPFSLFGISGLSFDSPSISSLVFLLMVHSPDFFPENS